MSSNNDSIAEIEIDLDKVLRLDDADLDWDLYKAKYGLGDYCPVYADNLEYGWEADKLKWDQDKTPSKILMRNYEGVNIIYDNPNSDFLKNIERARNEFKIRQFILKSWGEKKYYFVNLDADDDKILISDVEGYNEKNTLIQLLLYHKHIEKLENWERFRRDEYMQKLEYYAMSSQSVPIGEFLEDNEKPEFLD